MLQLVACCWEERIPRHYRCKEEHEGYFLALGLFIALNIAEEFLVQLLGCGGTPKLAGRARLRHTPDATTSHRSPPEMHFRAREYHAKKTRLASEQLGVSPNRYCRLLAPPTSRASGGVPLQGCPFTFPIQDPYCRP